MKHEEYFTHRDPKAFPLWQKAVVGIAGAGGLGSNIAMLLARAGIGTLIISDFDVVSIPNLNRQAFTIDQVGQPKVMAVKHNIHQVNPFINVQTNALKLTPSSVIEKYQDVDIMIEAFDKADQKIMLIETWLSHFPKKPLICASGLAGFGRSQAISQVQYDELYVIGDQSSELVPDIAPISTRVMLVAAWQANLALELLVKDA